jgi:hypoxanthine phosphoribosyltransferase
MLNKLVNKFNKNGLEPDLIIALSKGALIPAAMLLDRLGIECQVVGVRYYSNIYEVGKTPEIVQHIPNRVDGKKILLVDDVSDTGQTLKFVKEYLFEKGAVEIKTCTLHYKPGSLIKPDYYVEETSSWVIYPWEMNETVRYLVNKLESRGIVNKDIISEIGKTGIPLKIIQRNIK